MSVFDRSYFARNYRDYGRQNPPRKLRFYEQLVRAHLPARNGPCSVLEIGCGFGPFLAAIGTGWRKVGLDRSEYALHEARKFSPDAFFAVSDAAAAPVRGPFDVIVSFDVIEHVPDLDAVARGVQGALASDGVFVFVVPVYDGPLGPLVHLLDKDPTHLHKRSRAFWMSWAARYFQVLDAFGIVRYLLPHGPYLHWPSRLALRFGPAIAVCCRRETAV